MNYSQWHSKFFIFSHTQQKYPEDVIDTIRSELNIIKKNQDSDTHVYSKELLDIVSDYKNYWNESLSGMPGKTAQFYMKYVEMIHLYHDFSRSGHTGDFNTYVTSIPKIKKFFALNQPNYSRQLVKQNTNLLVAPNTHPEVYQELKKRMFGIKRSSKSFSRSPIDLALEKTINADAANQRTGILSLTNSISARQQWAESHFFAYVSHIKFIHRIKHDKKRRYHINFETT